MSARGRLADVVYRIVLLVFPSAMRRDVGPEMRQLFHDHRTAAATRRERAAIWMHAVGDALVHGLAERALQVRTICRTGWRELTRWRWWMVAPGQDLKYGARTLWRQPGVTAVAVLTLAIGIGANTAVFTAVNAVLLRPLPYKDPERLVMVWEKRAREGVLDNVVSPADFVDWTTMNTSSTRWPPSREPLRTSPGRVSRAAYAGKSHRGAAAGIDPRLRPPRRLTGSSGTFQTSALLTAGENGGVRVLIIEDDPKVAGAVRSGLEAEGYQAVVSRTGEDGFFRATTEPYDIILLDLGLPGRNGLEILSGLRGRGLTLPVLVLTARDGIEDRVLGLDSGADDYVVKPFAFAEVLARVRALLRRGRPEDALRVRLGDLELDPITRTARRGDDPVDLTVREFELLDYLLRHQGQVVSREMLARDVWKEPSRGTPIDNVIDVHITRLRKKIDQGDGPRLIHTIRGVGFLMKEGEP